MAATAHRSAAGVPLRLRSARGGIVSAALVCSCVGMALIIIKLNSMPRAAGDAGVVATTRMLETLVAQREATQRAAALQRGVSEPKQIVFGTFTCTRLIRRMLSCGICPF